MKATFKKRFALVGIGLSAAILGCFIFSGTVGAYTLGAPGNPSPITTSTAAGYLNKVQNLMNGTSSLPAAPSWLSGVFGAISQWFQNVVALGARWTGAPIPITIAGPLGSSITVPAQNLLAQFDTWLYSIAHFHIAIVLNFLVAHRLGYRVGGRCRRLAELGLQIGSRKVTK